jgi:hypothetical protein
MAEAGLFEAASAQVAVTEIEVDPIEIPEPQPRERPPTRGQRRPQVLQVAGQGIVAR